MKRTQMTIIAAALVVHSAAAQPERPSERRGIQAEPREEGRGPDLVDRPKPRVSDGSATSSVLEVLEALGDGVVDARAARKPQDQKAAGGQGGREFAQAIKRYERELADLNAATQRRRAELMRSLAEMKAKQAEAARERAKLPRQEGLEMRRWLDLTGLPPAPSWVIGVATKGDREEDGVEVERVLDNGPAAAAGIQAGDVIVACNQIKLRNRDALVKVLEAAQDQELTLTVLRRGKDADGKVSEARKIEIRITPQKTAALAPPPLPPGAIPYQIKPVQPPQPWPDTAWKGVPGRERPVPSTPYADNFNAPNRAAAEQLKKDNAEMRELLKQLIEEVKKLKKD